MNTVLIEITVEDIKTDEFSFEINKEEIKTNPYTVLIFINALNTLLESEMDKVFNEENLKLVINDNADLKAIYKLEDDGIQLAYILPKDKWELIKK